MNELSYEEQRRLEAIEQTKKAIKYITLGVLGFFILVCFFGSFELIQTGERGVVLRMGAFNRVMDEGFNLKLPFADSVKTMPVNTQKIEVEVLAASQDLQDVTTIIALNFNLMPESIGTLYTAVKKDYKRRLIDPNIQDSVKAATALFNAEELITKRPEVKVEIEKSLKEILGAVNIQVTGVSIVDFRFSPSFAQAIEKKVTAEQAALEQKNKLEEVKYIAQQDIEKAKAVAEKTRLEVQALAMGSDLIEKIEAEAKLEAAKKWNGVMPTHMYANAPMPFIQMAQ